MLESHVRARVPSQLPDRRHSNVRGLPASCIRVEAKLLLNDVSVGDEATADGILVQLELFDDGVDKGQLLLEVWTPNA